MPVECTACGETSEKGYRCEHCGKDLTDVGETDTDRAALGRQS